MMLASYWSIFFISLLMILLVWFALLCLYDIHVSKRGCLPSWIISRDITREPLHFNDFVLVIGSLRSVWIRLFARDCGGVCSLGFPTPNREAECRVRKGVGLWTNFWAVVTPVPDSLSHPIPSGALCLNCFQYFHFSFLLPLWHHDVFSSDPPAVLSVRSDKTLARTIQEYTEQTFLLCREWSIFQNVPGAEDTHASAAQRKEVPQLQPVRLLKHQCF